ncbi:hypothetical protein LEP1GSC151_4752 [Leptospira interrogans serovar Grippotyphosa str. LT2186]|uniref:Uncharacterized protein n=1 Tax=Leptospira interrogans serovar Grippotyphosa str. LT2186 TaxID=1001599 RepID=M3ICQ8_LEPIR|nr:hypothetical protein [Leptospira interrogans]EMG13116.1 hypothetical protein LEP1GSC151_4752 [Leptospira interrogans serovar Grippotyphosa str. LT2186]EKR45601.1 hypothetical protein LEP1GSC097_4475 [Leptospira interrogans serovar Grippotyphosa str. UI 08368]EMN86271.1 hypothetical protein LEP1GSC107_0981 [Leptospira interrogans serovar Grippotyphosa str. UI 12769]KGE28193.1 hypothetical protein IQ65_02080 [Leptospira interrogans serovar Lai]UML85158.1 hypothetical protein FH587_06450 [Lept
MIESRKYFQPYNKFYEYSKNVKYSIPEYSKSKNNFQFSFYNKLIIFSKNLIKFPEKPFTKPKGKLSSRQISG